MGLLPAGLLVTSFLVNIASARDVIQSDLKSGERSPSFCHHYFSPGSGFEEAGQSSPADEVVGSAGADLKRASVVVYDVRKRSQNVTDVLGYHPKELEGVELRVLVVVDKENRASEIRYELARIKDPEAGRIQDYLSEQQQDEIKALESSFLGSGQMPAQGREEQSRQIIAEVLQSFNRMSVRTGFAYTDISGSPEVAWKGDFQPVVMMQQPPPLKKQDSFRDGDDSDDDSDKGRDSDRDHLSRQERGAGSKDSLSPSGSGDQPPGKPGKSNIPEQAKSAIKMVLGYPFTLLVAAAAGLGSNFAFDAIQEQITQDSGNDLKVATEEAHSQLLQYYGQSTFLIKLTPAEYERQLARQNTSDFRETEAFLRYGFQFTGVFYRARKGDEFLAAFPGCPCPQGPVWTNCGVRIGVSETDLVQNQLQNINFSQELITLAGIPVNVTPTFWCPCNICPVPEQSSGTIDASSLARFAWDIMFVGIPAGLTFLVEYYSWHRQVYLKYIQPGLQSRFGF